MTEKPRVTFSPQKLSLQADVQHDPEDTYEQTRAALKEAIAEQTILKKRLRSIEKRNKPAKFGRPVQLRSIHASFGPGAEDIPPEGLVLELQKAQTMLESAHKASVTAQQEQMQLNAEIEQFEKRSVGDVRSAVLKNALKHKNELQAEQQQFRTLINSWNHQRSEFLVHAEELSIVSQASICTASQARKEVDAQRSTMKALAIELRRHLSQSKDLRTAIDQGKAKVALVKNLKIEIEANEEHLDVIKRLIEEQKTILKAVRVSEQAQSVLDDLDEQINDLKNTKEEVTMELQRTLRDQGEIRHIEMEGKAKLDAALNMFKRAQTEMFVLESDVRELRAEHDKQKRTAVRERRRHVDLQRQVRVERMEATQRFVYDNSDKIHRVDRVQSTLARVRSKLDKRPGTAAPSRGATRPTVTRKTKDNLPKTARRPAA